MKAREDARSPRNIGADPEGKREKQRNRWISGCEIGRI